MPGGDQYEEYDEASVVAAQSAIIELMTVLGEYRDEIVLVGGWVPFFSMDAPEDPLDRHPGSADVDIVLDHRELEEAGYETIAKRLEDAGYKPVGEQPFQFSKTVHGVVVHIDLLAGQYAGTGKKHRTQKIQDVKARKARGADLVFQIRPDKREISGQLPDGHPQKLRDSRLVDLLSRGTSQKSRNKCEIEGPASGSTLRRSERFLDCQCLTQTGEAYSRWRGWSTVALHPDENGLERRRLRSIQSQTSLGRTWIHNALEKSKLLI